MKKMIALLLAMALCLGLFAGCGNDQPEASTGLADAKVYLEAMYKDESEITAVDYTRVGVVMIDGVSYTVTWTADNESIKITAADKMVKVELPDTLEEISYTLTATIADAEGNTETVTFARTVPAAAGLPTTIEDGTYVILGGNKTMSSLTEDKSYGYPYTTEVTVADGTVSGHKAADVLTITNVEGGVTIQDAYGRYFYLKGTYNSFNVDATAPAEGHVWEILKNGDDYLIVNAMNKKTLALSASYGSWGAYPELTEDHTSLLAIIPATAPAEDPVEPPVENNDPEADTTLSIADAIALGASKAHNTYTEGKYYVTGVITEIYNDTYGNMYITDDAGNVLTIYGTYDATGENRYDAMATKPVAGDTVTIYGIIGQYNDNPQIKNGWIVEHTPASGGQTEEPTEPEATEPEATEPAETEPAAPSVPATLAEQIAEANKLANKEHLSYESTITGTITDDPYPSSYNEGQYKFTVSDGTNTLLCYYVPVTGGTPAKGATVTVTGYLTAYNGSAQFDESAAAVIVGGGAEEEPTEPEQPAVSGDIVTAPEVGTAYKLGLFSTAKNETYYLAGGMNGYYMATTTDKAAAVDVYLETAEGGYYMYYMDGSAKVYIDIVPSGTHINAVQVEAPGVVYTYNTEYNTMVATVDGNEYYIGTYGNYTTMGPSKISYAASSYVAQFYAA